jgi:hypothetical protein
VTIAGWGAYNLSNEASDTLKTAKIEIQSFRYGKAKAPLVT